MTPTDHDRAPHPLDPELGRALAATRAQLAAEPELTAPTEVVARWLAAVSADVGGPTRPEAERAPVSSDRTAPSHGRVRRACSSRPGAARAARGWLARPVLVAAGLVAVLAGALLVRSAPPPALPLTRVDLAAAGPAAVGVLDVGHLADPARRVACLAAVGVPADAPLLGGRRVVLDGRPGQLLVLGTGERGRFRLVVVDPACGALLADTSVGP